MCTVQRHVASICFVLIGYRHSELGRAVLNILAGGNSRTLVPAMWTIPLVCMNLELEFCAVRLGSCDDDANEALCNWRPAAARVIIPRWQSQSSLRTDHVWSHDHRTCLLPAFLSSIIIVTICVNVTAHQYDCVQPVCVTANNLRHSRSNSNWITKVCDLLLPKQNII